MAKGTGEGVAARATVMAVERVGSGVGAGERDGDVSKVRGTPEVR